jgi:hypothetical protein
MNAQISHGYGYQDPSRRIKGIVVVVLVHALIGYALVSGMARKGLNLIKKPLEAVVIQEVIIPPPPPPPPPPKKIEPPKEAPKPEAPPPPLCAAARCCPGSHVYRAKHCGHRYAAAGTSRHCATTTASTAAACTSTQTQPHRHRRGMPNPGAA